MNEAINAAAIAAMALFPAFLCLLAIWKRRLALKLALAATGFGGVMILTEPDLKIPVAGAGTSDWNPDSYWYEPWGASIVHQGIDIFARRGAGIIAPTGLLILATSAGDRGGLFVVGIDRALRLHYFAHLGAIEVEAPALLKQGSRIGSAGNSGNARGKPVHLHYGLLSIIPRPWNITSGTLGAWRGYFLDPAQYFPTGAPR